jgi:hypothetical protein
MPAKQADSIYRLKITLREVKPPIWRRVEVPGGIALASLHEILNEAMGWFDGHLHDFEIDGIEFTAPDTEYMTESEAEDEARWRLDAVVTQPGTRFRYRYDFGDGWDHDVVVEAIEAPVAGVTYPRVTAGRRACPPEDCGGPWGYRELLEALADPTHEDHEGQSAWVPQGFDPEAFSIAETNAVLAARFRDLKPLRRRTGKAPTKRPSAAERMAADLAPDTVKVAADGTVRLPPLVLASMGLTGGGTAILLTVGTGVMLMRDPRSKG